MNGLGRQKVHPSGPRRESESVATLWQVPGYDEGAAYSHVAKYFTIPPLPVSVEEQGRVRGTTNRGTTVWYCGGTATNRIILLIRSVHAAATTVVARLKVLRASCRTAAWLRWLSTWEPGCGNWR
jgi:hypothetical protein